MIVYNQAASTNSMKMIEIVRTSGDVVNPRIERFHIVVNKLWVYLNHNCTACICMYTYALCIGKQ